MRTLFTAALLFSSMYLSTNSLYGSAFDATNQEVHQQKINQLQGIERSDYLILAAKSSIDQKDFANATILINQSIQFSQKEKYFDNLAKSYDLQGLIYQSKYDYSSAIESYVNGLKLRQQNPNNNQLSQSYFHIGYLFLLERNFDQAEKNLKKAVELQSKNNKNTLLLLDTYSALGELYKTKGVYEPALEYYNLALRVALETDQEIKAINIATTLGQSHSDLGEHETALQYFQKSNSIATKMNLQEQMATANYSIASALIVLDLIEDAAQANQEAYELSIKLENPFLTALTQINQAKIKFKNNNTEEAKEALQKAIITSNQVKKSSEKAEIISKITGSYQNMKDYKRAYMFQKLYTNEIQKVQGEEKNNALLELTTRYQSEFAAEEKEKEIVQLQAKQSQARIIRWFLVGIIGLIGLFLMQVFNSYRNKKKDNELLKSKNIEIENKTLLLNDKNQELANKNSALDLVNSQLVTEIAERESIEKSSFARDRFLATMSQEMRTPINIIIGLTHMLLDENPRIDQVDHLRTLQFSANNLVVFINDVLDFSKIEANKLNLEKRSFSPEKTIAEIKSRFDAQIKSQNVIMVYHLDKNIPNQLWGDAIRFNQIITNILSTSVKNTPKGVIDMNFELEENKLDNVILKIRIQDNGKGLSENLIQQLQSSTSTVEDHKDIFEGYSSQNLSLVITKKLIELQNGTFLVETNPSNGTIFEIRLPFQLSVSNNKIKARQILDSSLLKQNLKGKKILLAEDNKINQVVVAKMLRKLKTEVVTADDGQEAIDALEIQNFDLILMDIQMPNVDGYRATAEIRKHPDPIKRNTPIIALTASAFLTEKEKAKLFGMNDHVGKPFSPEELLERIFTLLGVEA